MKTLWLAVLALAFACYAAVVAPSERTVRALERESQDLYELANRNEAVLAQRTSLIRLRDRVRRDLDELGAEKTPAKAALAFIELLDRQGKSRDVFVGTFAPDETAPGEDAQEIALTIRGSYEDVLAYVSDVTRHRPLVELESVELHRQSDGSDGTQIDGQLRVVLYHAANGLIQAIQREVRQHDTTAHD